MFDLWLKACQENGTTIFDLGNGLYKTQKDFEHSNNYYRTTPVYHVWQGDKRIYCGLSYQTALKANGG